MDLTVCLKALGDPTRFMIFQQLLARRHCTRALARKLGITEAAVSQHLKILWEAGLVYKEKYGYHTHYRPAREAMDFLAAAFETMRQRSRDAYAAPQACQCECGRQAQQEAPAVEKGQGAVRVAIPYSDGRIYQHFGHAEAFKLYDVENGAVRSTCVVPAGGCGHGALAVFLKRQQADAVICGGIGAGARAALHEAGMALYAGVRGEADAAVDALIAGTLSSEAVPACACGMEACKIERKEPE